MNVRALVIGMILLAATVFAQEEESPATLLPRVNYYPEFVTDPPPATVLPESGTDTLAEDDATTASLSGIARKRQQLQVLAADLASTNTWHQIRTRFELDIEEVRIMMLAQDPPEAIREQADFFIEELDILVRMAPYQAPVQEAGLAFQRDRIKRQTLYLVEDYANQEWRQFNNTDAMLRDSIRQFQALLAQSDLDRGSPVLALYEVPDDWGSGRYRAEDLAERIGGWDTRQLLAAYKERQASIELALRKDEFSRDAILAAEMSELARVMATRLYEVPVVSRIGFRDAALRLDVMAENLAEYMNEGNRLYARRQLRYVNRGVEDVESYLALPMGRAAGE